MRTKLRKEIDSTSEENDEFDKLTKYKIEEKIENRIHRNIS